MPFTRNAALDHGVQGPGQRQVEPLPFPQDDPAQPVSLTPASQCLHPLPLDFFADPHVHGFPALGVLSANPTSHCSVCLSQECSISSSILRPGPLRVKTAVDLSGSSMLPFPSVPCSLTPPQSPATIALCGDLLLPSSHYDSVGLRFLIFTRLNRFTYVTARSSLVPTLSSCRCLHVPKARFPVGRLIPLSEAGISPAGSIRLGLTHHSAGRCSPG